MTERERLIELLNTVIFPREGADPAEVVADFLLDNGVRLPVTCGECEHGCESSVFDNKVVCHKSYEFKIPEVYHNNDFYCSCGERRADNGT